MQWARTKCVDQDLVPSRVDNPMHPLPLIYAFPPSKVGLLPDLFDLGETARVFPSLPAGLVSFSKPLGRSFL